MILVLNKNGQSMHDLYCWKCTGDHARMRHASTGKGRMRETNRRMNNGTIYIEYRCLKCSTYAEYEDSDWNDYGIHA